MALTFRGGVYLPEERKTRAGSIRIFNSPKTVSIPVLQHTGASCVLTVKKGDRVDVGQVIGEGAGDVGYPVYASVSGTVVAIEETKDATDAAVWHVIIENDGENRVSTQIKPYLGSFEDLGPDDIIDTIRKAGISEYKLIEEAKGKVDTLIVNCVESEPYSTVKQSLLLEDADSVLGGMKIVLKALALRTGDIAVEDNNPEAIRLIRGKIKGMDYGEVKVLKSKYPQGNERALVYSVIGKEICVDKSPQDEGCIVIDARTCADIYNAFVYGMPLVSHTVTVDGDCIAEPSCVRCPVGTAVSELISLCGASSQEIKYIINGGPMTGKELLDPDTLVTKEISALLVLSDIEEYSRKQACACIRCGRCVNACPMHLLPNYLAVYSEKGRYDLCEKYDVMSCTECGVCSYVCPARIHITTLNRQAKLHIREKGDKNNE